MCRIVTHTPPFVSGIAGRGLPGNGGRGRLVAFPMVIKASAAAEIRQLVSALAADDDVAREAAIARLGVIGERAVRSLAAAYRATTRRGTHLAILRALEPSGDGRALPIARDALAKGGDVAVAGVAVLGGLLDARDDRTASAALDALLGVVTDPSAEHRLRLAAADALRGVGAVREQVASALLQVRQDAPAGQGTEDAALAATWLDLLAGHLPDRPETAAAVVRMQAETAPPGTLKEVIDRLRLREDQSGDELERAGWRAARGAAHQGLAFRGSRLAVYDLRESLERTREPLPASFVTALHAVGDESCLEAIAAAFSHSTDDRWRAQLRGAFQAIARRDRVSRRKAVIKRIAARWPDAARELEL